MALPEDLFPEGNGSMKEIRPAGKKGRKSSLSSPAFWQGLYEHLEELYGPQKCFLDHRTAFELLVATILSAQCTDKRVNLVTKKLFARASTPEEFALMPQEELEEYIHSCGFYRAKAEHILGAAQKIVSDFQGELPSTMEGLTSLPGVGRKTANVVLADSFGVPGFPVDTHVIRLTNHFGIGTKDPHRIEEEVTKLFPFPEKLGELSHLLILHGRSCCKAGNPDCASCSLVGSFCPGKCETKKRKTAK